MIRPTPTTPAGRALTLVVDNPGELDAEAIAAHLFPAPRFPARLTIPNGTTAEVVSVQARYTLRAGGSWHESMSVETWRRQGNVREELRDLARGGDRAEE